MAGTTKQVPVVAGLFTETPSGPALIGSKCTSCGTYYFPKGITCRNPRCKEKKVEEVALSRHGILWSYTILYYPPPPPFKMDPFTPYAIGLVELPEGIRVLGMMSTPKPEGLKPGTRVQLVLERLHSNEQGQDVVTWKFRPE